MFSEIDFNKALDLFKNNNENLTELDLSYNYIGDVGDEGAKALSEA